MDTVDDEAQAIYDAVTPARASLQALISLAASSRHAANWRALLSQAVQVEERLLQVAADLVTLKDDVPSHDLDTLRREAVGQAFGLARTLRAAIEALRDESDTHALAEQAAARARIAEAAGATPKRLGTVEGS